MSLTTDFVLMYCLHKSHVTYSLQILSLIQASGIDLPLPPKKVFGNMDAAFIAERQQGLQVSQVYHEHVHVSCTNAQNNCALNICPESLEMRK